MLLSVLVFSFSMGITDLTFVSHSTITTPHNAYFSIKPSHLLKIQKAILKLALYWSQPIKSV